MTKKPLSKEEFLEKHPPLTDKQIKEKFKDARMAKDKYTKEMKEIEKNLMGYIEISEPLIDPETDNILAWVKLPTMMELENFYGQFGETKPEEYEVMSKEEKLKIINRQYELMAEMIVTPKHDAEWWKTHSNMRLLKLFSVKLEQIFEEMGVATENFPEAT